MLVSENFFSKRAIEEDFVKSFKSKEDLKVGMEFERLPISTKDYKNVSYNDGICNFLRKFAALDNWEFITDDYNIIGLKKGKDTITLEPGAQVELSLEPEKSISKIKEKIDNFNKKSKPILKKYDINLLEYGVSPVSTYRYIDLIPKHRYHLMADYLWGILSDVMMRETAGIQGCFDYESEEDAIEKFRLANILSPFVTAMCANSPIRGGVDTGYKTFRSLTWLNTDNERCHFMNKNLFNGNYTFDSYIDEVMDTPMIFITRNGKNIPINGKITFKEFAKSGYEGFNATLEDFKLHENLYFPDVRLRNFIEIRNHDCSNHGMQYSILALYKGILYNKSAFNAVKTLLDKFSYKQISEFRFCVPRMALGAKIGKYYARDIAKEILEISRKALFEAKEQEEKFLDPLMELTPHGITQADVILRNWNGSWNKDISKLINYLNN